MFPKCGRDVPNITTLRKHSENIPGILRDGWVATTNLVSKQKNMCGFENYTVYCPDTVNMVTGFRFMAIFIYKEFEGKFQYLRTGMC